MEDYLPERDFGPEIRRTLNQETKEYALKLLATYGLYEFKDKYPSQLSGNEAKSGSYKNLVAKPRYCSLMKRFQRWITRQDWQ